MDRRARGLQHLTQRAEATDRHLAACGELAQSGVVGHDDPILLPEREGEHEVNAVVHAQLLAIADDGVATSDDSFWSISAVGPLGAPGASPGKNEADRFGHVRWRTDSCPLRA